MTHEPPFSRQHPSLTIRFISRHGHQGSEHEQGGLPEGENRLPQILAGDLHCSKPPFGEQPGLKLFQICRRSCGDCELIALAILVTGAMRAHYAMAGGCICCMGTSQSQFSVCPWRSEILHAAPLRACGGVERYLPIFFSLYFVDKKIEKRLHPPTPWQAGANRRLRAQQAV